MKRKNILSYSYLIGIFFFGGSVVYAQPRIDGLVDIFNRVVDLVFPVGGLIAMGMIVYGGYMWMIAAGDPGKARQAQGVLTWAIIGLIFLAVFGLLLNMFVDFLK